MIHHQDIPELINRNKIVAIRISDSVYNQRIMELLPENGDIIAQLNAAMPILAGFKRLRFLAHNQASVNAKFKSPYVWDVQMQNATPAITTPQGQTMGIPTGYIHQSQVDMQLAYMKEVLEMKKEIEIMKMQNAMLPEQRVLPFLPYVTGLAGMALGKNPEDFAKWGMMNPPSNVNGFAAARNSTLTFQAGKITPEELAILNKDLDKLTSKISNSGQVDPRDMKFLFENILKRPELVAKAKMGIENNLF